MTDTHSHNDSRPRKRFDERATFLCPAGLLTAVETAAARNCTTASGYIRQALVAAVRADGVNLEHTR